MAREISTNGKKKIKTLKKEFNEHFPYLRLNIHEMKYKKIWQEGGTIYGVDQEKTLSEVREKIGAGEISLHGRSKVLNIEKEFEEIFGLYVQVCYSASDGKRYYTSGSFDKLSLTQLNKHIESIGGIQNIWS